MERQPGRGFHADPRQAVQVGNETAQGRRNDIHKKKAKGKRLKVKGMNKHDATRFIFFTLPL
jgi:hypothetical protein